ncbi:SPOR domain-containing protein [Oceanibium sediminis]|uniref:SPOR domain-containing protein n=1 Tax=Oceanibium sediminis TaxID=2026339 RepID=UPI000DD4C973|nr:SPOR domain-containing protein [Oceanibium sediminis]
MQDMLYEEYADGAPQSGVRRLLAVYAKWGGAAISLLVLVSFIVWAYRLGQRDASDIPVIRAMDGPVRVQPADPGGTVVGNQGLEVNEILAGDSAGQPERISVAPATLPLREEDTPADPDSGADEAAETDTAFLEAAPETTGAEDGEAGVDGTATDIAALIEEVNAEDQTDVLLEEGADIDFVDSGVNADLRPQPRPRGFRPAPAAPSAAADGPAAVAANTRGAQVELTAGTRLIQLGAFDSAELAEGQWDLLQEAHGDLLGSKDRFVQRAEQNGRVFYRLRVVGFDDRNAQRAMCEALRARDVDCIPVTVR